MSFEGARFCAHCDQPLRSGEPVDRMTVFSASGPGTLVELHKVCLVAPLLTARGVQGGPTALWFR